MPFLDTFSVPNQFIKKEGGISLFLKREDLLHPEISGNKFRKLKYNFQKAISEGKNSILTFGGAYSNHIAATAAAGKLFGIKTIGVIRGEELGGKNIAENATLDYAVSCGMKLKFISRNDYRKKDSEEIILQLKNEFGNFYLLPEGGTNELAVKGCEEILTEEDKQFNIICCSVGTGGTIAGIINSSASHQKILGFPALKGDFLEEEIKRFSKKNNWQLIIDYHFGGYAKVNAELVNFINIFGKNYGIALDPVYTGKMMFGIFDLIQKGYFLENSKILAIHTGGLQGISGMNSVLKNKGLAQIEII